MLFTIPEEMLHSNHNISNKNPKYKTTPYCLVQRFSYVVFSRSTSTTMEKWMNHFSQGTNIMTVYELFQQYNVNSAVPLWYSNRIILKDTSTWCPFTHGEENVKCCCRFWRFNSGTYIREVSLLFIYVVLWVLLEQTKGEIPKIFHNHLDQ